MAQKRMFDKRVVESDKFTDLPNSSKALYFLAGMSADDKGFFQPRRLQKIHGFTDDDFKILIAKGYFIPFESGVVVITDWNKNNWLDSRRITETEYVDELKLLKLINEKYELRSEQDVAKPMLSQNSIEENRIIEKENIKEKERFKKPTLEEVEEYCRERNSSVNPKTFYEYFETGGWVDSKGNKVKNWKQKIITWEKHATAKTEVEPQWFKEEQNIRILSKQEQEEMEAILNDIRFDI